MNPKKRRKVILDVDTGSDDAVAILAALLSEELDVLGICTVWGNLEVEQTTYNTLALVSALGMETPVYAGCSRSMVKDRTPARVSGGKLEPILKDGKMLAMHPRRLPGLPDTERTPETLHAVEYYYQALREATEPVNIVAVAPLTNLGFLFRLAPELAGKVGELVIMGGGLGVTNASSCGEANTWHDPEALQILLDAGLSPLLVTLDATHSAALTEEDCALLEGTGTFAGRFAAGLIRQRIGYEQARFPGRGDWSPVHDALAVCALLDPSLLTRVEEAHCRIECTGACDGEVLVDRRARPQPPNARLALEADRKRFAALLTHLLGKGGQS